MLENLADETAYEQFMNSIAAFSLVFIGIEIVFQSLREDTHTANSGLFQHLQRILSHVPVRLLVADKPVLKL